MSDTPTNEPRIWPLVFILWVAMWCVTYPALLAELQGNISFDPSFARKECRHDAGYAAAIALLPPSWLLAPFVTGFYESGFKWG